MTKTLEKSWRLCLMAGLALAPAVARAESLEDVKKKIHEKLSTLKSLSYKMKMTSELALPTGAMKSEMEQTFEAMRKDGRVWSRADMKQRTTQKEGGKDATTETTMTNVSDGVTELGYVESPGQKTAVRRKVDPSSTFNPFESLRYFKEQEKTFSFKLLPDQKIDGNAVWVVETTPRDEVMKTYMSRTLVYYDQSTGITLKSETFDKDGKSIGSAITTDIKLNPDIKPSRFDFKPPPDVKIQVIEAPATQPAASKPEP